MFVPTLLEVGLEDLGRAKRRNESLEEFCWGLGGSTMALVIGQKRCCPLDLYIIICIYIHNSTPQSTQTMRPVRDARRVQLLQKTKA